MKKSKPKMGRPSSTPGQKKSWQMRIRFTHKERLMIEAASKDRERSVHSWARITILDAAKKSYDLEVLKCASALRMAQ